MNQLTTTAQGTEMVFSGEPPGMALTDYLDVLRRRVGVMVAAAVAIFVIAAVVALALSFLGALISLIYGKLIDPPPAPPVGMEITEWMPYGILLIAALLVWYALAMAKRGVLR